jgi:hypothetical protein
MSRTYHHGERRIRVRSIRKENPDAKKIARALIAYARAEAEKEAQAATRPTRHVDAANLKRTNSRDAKKGDAA